MTNLVAAVRVAIVVSAMLFGMLLWSTQEMVPGMKSGATFVNGEFYAPGRKPGDGK